jgi:phospholipase/carboxylesterase
MALPLAHRAELPEPGDRGPYPAVVMVHGWLGDEMVMGIFGQALPRGVVVVSPRGPLAVDDDNYGWYEHLNDLEGFRAGLSALRGFVTGLPGAYPVDARRVWLMGFSQGAAMSLALLLSDPVLVAGVVALAGFVPEFARPWTAPRKLAGKPVLILHGREDETVTVEQAHAARDLLAAAGADVTYHEYDVGHKLNAQGMRDLQAWLEAKVTPGA